MTLDRPPLPFHRFSPPCQNRKASRDLGLLPTNPTHPPFQLRETNPIPQSPRIRRARNLPQDSRVNR
jgi:hypothetical protein